MRRLSVTHYAEWVLGNQRSRMAPFIVTEIDQGPPRFSLAIPGAWIFPVRVAFMDMGGGAARRRRPAGIPGQLRLAGGAGGAARRPSHCPNGAGAGFDPCGALQTRVRARAGRGDGDRAFLGQEACAEAPRWTCIEAIPRRGSRRLAQGGHRILGADAWRVQVKTPDRSMDVILNGWLLYQTLVLPAVGAYRVLPIERRVGIPRSTAGCDGALRGAADDGARAHLARRGSPVQRGRRAALVAAGHEPGHQDARVR